MLQVMTLPKNKIKLILDQQGKSMYWLANKVDMSNNAISALAKAETIPDGTNYGTLRRVAQALGVRVGDLEDDD